MGVLVSRNCFWSNPGPIFCDKAIFIQEEHVKGRELGHGSWEQRQLQDYIIQFRFFKLKI